MDKRNNCWMWRFRFAAQSDKSSSWVTFDIFYYLQQRSNFRTFHENKVFYIILCIVNQFFSRWDLNMVLILLFFKIILINAIN